MSLSRNRGVRTPVVNRAGRESRTVSTGIVTIASRAAGIMLAGAAGWLVYGRPVASVGVAVVLIACGALQLRFPGAWLVTLPALLPVFDLTLWSGRIYVSEFDGLVLTSAAAHFLTAPPRWQFPRLSGFAGAILGLLVLSLIASAVVGAWPLPSPDDNQLGSYLSNYNALRVVKSVVWALLLLAPLQMHLSRDPDQTAKLFMVGTSIGLVLLGIVVLWERGVFLAIARAPDLYVSRYSILGALLDFTWEYRATALFSELDTGGEAIDTYLSLAVPIAAAGALWLRQPVPRLLCLGALGLGTYAIVATFSRGLYLGFGAGIAVVLVLALHEQAQGLHGRVAPLRAAGAIALFFAALLGAYAHGGFAALGLGLALAGTVLAIGHFVGRRSWLLASPLILVSSIVGCYALAQAFSSSHYNETSIEAAWLWAAGLALTLTIAAALLGGRTIPAEHRLGAGTTFVVLAIVAAIGIPATGGTRMIERFATTSDDAHVRWKHWAEVLRLMGDSWESRFFGVGLGRFPQLHFRRGTETESNASYQYRNDGTRTWVELGVGDFNLTQKIALKPDTKYTLTVTTRAIDGSGRPTIKLCPKLILYSDRYTPGCPDWDFRSEPPGEWVPHTVSFDSGPLGRDIPFGWPITLLLGHGSGSGVIDVTGIELSDGQTDIVANGSFAAGGDHWLMISDFDHLAWHIKNLYLEVFFESGALGLVIFLIAMITGLTSAVRAARRLMPIGIGLSGALVGSAVVGVTGSLLDNPRPAFLLFFALFWSLQLARWSTSQGQTWTMRPQGQRATP